MIFTNHDLPAIVAGSNHRRAFLPPIDGPVSLGIRARALKAGVICYLPKPFEESDLLNCIQAALDRAKENGGTP